MPEKYRVSAFGMQNTDDLLYNTCMISPYTIKACGDTGLLLELGKEIDPKINRICVMTAKSLKEKQVPGIRDIIPSYAAVMVSYDPSVLSFSDVKDTVLSVLSETELNDETESAVISIPVLYDGEDLPFVAENAGLSIEEAIRIHTEGIYHVYMMGFLPGFAYLGGLDERLKTPRLSSPRKHVPQGSVGIAGMQTGVYPLDSPGGWQLIGRTPLKLYDPKNSEAPILLHTGDTVRFVQITEEEFASYAGGSDVCKNH